jgi:hypothetical protein
LRLNGTGEGRENEEKSKRFRVIGHDLLTAEKELKNVIKTDGKIVESQKNTDKFSAVNPKCFVQFFILFDTKNVTH